MPTTLTALQSTVLLVDNDGDGVVDPGDVIQTNVTVSNTGLESATNVSFTETLNGMTLNGGTLNASPIAFNDSYSAATGVPFTASTSVLANDTEPLGPEGLGLNTGTAIVNPGVAVATTQGGSATFNVDGTFTYTSAAGFEGTDTFTYTLRDTGIDGIAGNADDLTSTGTVSITVAPAPTIWFIDNSVSGGPGDGTQDNPFRSIAEFNAANDGAAGHPGDGDVVYLRFGTGTYTEADGINLANGQTLIGQGQDLVVGGNIIEQGDPSLTPTIQIVNGDTDDGIDLAQNNTISGLNVDNLGSGIGIDDNGNVGTLNISDISVSTTSGTGIELISGGTVTFTGAGNTISSATGTALNISNTTIGAADVTFESISSNGGSNAGIILNTTGTLGGLHVTGDGGGTNNGSGGTIQNKLGVVGISLTNTTDVSLSYMNIQNGGDDGIRGSSVNGFTLDRSNVTNNGNSVGERGIDMTELGGSGGISNSTISGSAEHNVIIANDTVDLTVFNVTGTTFSTNNSLIGDDGFQVLNTGSAVMNVSVTGSTFIDNKGDHFQAATDNSASGSINITFNGNTLTTTAGNDPSVVGGGIVINLGDAADITFQINNNNIQQAFDDAILIINDPSSQVGATMTGTISGNTIGTSGVVGSGSESSNDITVRATGNGLVDVDILDNNIFGWTNAFGIFLSTGEGDANMIAKVTGNTLHTPDPVLSLNGIHAVAGQVAGDGGTLELVLTGNDVTGEGAIGSTDIRLRQRFETTIKLPGYAGANDDSTAVNTFVAGNNDPAGDVAPTVSSINNVGGGGGGYIGGAPTSLLAGSGEAQIAALEPMSLGAPIDIGTLPADQTVTIQWRATIDPQTNQLIVNPVNQGQVTGDNFTSPVSTNQVTTELDSLSLGNLVFNDVNHNGVFDAGTDTGIIGVSLTLFADDGDGVFDADDIQIATTTTAGGGLYSFTGLAPGTYMVRADQSNFDPGGALQGTPLSAINTVDPDNNVNNDDNANPVAGNGVVTLPITLGYNTEPTAGVGNDTNFTLDIGVQANVVTITGSTRADTINATTTVAGQPLPTGGDDFITGGKGKDTIEALGGNDFIDGGRDADRLEGGAGTDVLVGGEGDDTFVFKAGFGNDFINDFEEAKKKGDVIEIHDNIFADFADVLNHSTEDGSGNVVITADAGNSITLVDVPLANLNANDFHFV